MWIKITDKIKPPNFDIEILIKDEYGNEGVGIPLYTPFKVGPRTGCKYTEEITPCEPYFDGWMVSSGTKLKPKIEGKITHFKHDFVFDTEDQFLKVFDGEIYCVANADNTEFVCDLFMKDLDKFVEEGKIYNHLSMGLDDIYPDIIGTYSDYFLVDDKFKEKVQELCVTIKILEDANN